MDKVILYNNLFDIYGDSLAINKQDIFRLYYVENLSMQEIADEKGVSKSLVGKVVKEVEKKLNEFENNFHLLELKNDLKKIEECDDLVGIKKEIHSLINKI